MCKLTTCCGCCSLEAGVIIQGCLDCTLGSTLAVTAVWLWPLAIMYPELVESRYYGEGSEKERTHVLIIVFMVVFTIHSILLLIRAGVLIAAAFSKTAPFVMTGIVLTVIEIVLYLCFSICLFSYFNPIFGALTTLYVLITVHCLIVLIGYYLQLRSGLPDAHHTGVVYSIPDNTARHQVPRGIHVEASTPVPFTGYARDRNDALNLASSPENQRPVIMGEPLSTPSRQSMGPSQGPGTPFTTGELPVYSISPSRKPEAPLPTGTPLGYHMSPSWDSGSTFTYKVTSRLHHGFITVFRNAFTNKDFSRISHGPIKGTKNNFADRYKPIAFPTSPTRDYRTYLPTKTALEYLTSAQREPATATLREEPHRYRTTL